MRLTDTMADRILRLSEMRGMSVRQMARFSGVSESSLYMVTCRQRELSCTNLRKLCRGMKVSADWLLGLEEE